MSLLCNGVIDCQDGVDESSDCPTGGKCFKNKNFLCLSVYPMITERQSGIRIHGY